MLLWANTHLHLDNVQTMPWTNWAVVDSKARSQLPSRQGSYVVYPLHAHPPNCDFNWVHVKNSLVIYISLVECCLWMISVPPTTISHNNELLTTRLHFYTIKNVLHFLGRFLSFLRSVDCPVITQHVDFHFLNDSTLAFWPKICVKRWANAKQKSAHGSSTIVSDSAPLLIDYN